MAPGTLEMTFAERQLAKYGWKKGMGLGKKNDGISEPIKVKACQNNLGIGNDPKKHLSHWWDMAYNRAVNNIVVERSENGHIEVKSGTECSITKEKPNLFNTNVLYDDFKQAGMLKGIQFTSNSRNDDDSDSNDSVKLRGVHRGQGLLLDMTDAELFNLCGGGTAHKGARHGIRMGGKMKRIKQMEEAEAALVAALVPPRQRDVIHHPDEKILEGALNSKKNCVEGKDFKGENSLQPCTSDGCGNDVRNHLNINEVVSSGTDTEVPKKKKKKSKNGKNHDVPQIDTLHNATKTESSPKFDEDKISSMEHCSNESDCKETKKKKRKRQYSADVLVDVHETTVKSFSLTQEKKRKRNRKHESKFEEEEQLPEVVTDTSVKLDRKKKKENKYKACETRDESKENCNDNKNKKKRWPKEVIDEPLETLEAHQTSEEIRHKKKKRKKQTSEKQNC